MDANAKKPEWLKYLHEHGVVVVQDVLDEQEVTTSVDKYWQFLDNNNKFMMKKFPDKWKNGDNLVSKDSRTLNDKNWPVTRHGFSARNYSNHSDCAWYMRTRPNVKKCFEQIYQTNELITSFDTIIAWRQWWLNEEDPMSWLPRTEGLHID